MCPCMRDETTMYVAEEEVVIGVEREIEDMNVIATKRGGRFEVVWDMHKNEVHPDLTLSFFFKVDPFGDNFNLTWVYVVSIFLLCTT